MPLMPWLTSAIYYGIVRCNLHLIRKEVVELGANQCGIKDYRPEGSALRPNFTAWAEACATRNDAELIRLRNDPVASFEFIRQYRAALARRGQAGQRVGYEKVQVSRAGGKTSRVEQKVRERQRDQAQAIIEYFEVALRTMGIDPAAAQTPSFIRELQRDISSHQLSLPLTT